jgi:hypothetical protein
LSLLAAEPIEELLDGAVTRLGPVEVDSTHADRLTQT